MLKQYELVNNCLNELQKSSLPEKYRWKLEMLLYQLRRLLLLDTVVEMVRNDPHSVEDFEELHRAITCACNSSSHLPTLDPLLAVPSEMKKALYSYCRKEGALTSHSDDSNCHLPRQ
jgi:hypothetical protein